MSDEPALLRAIADAPDDIQLRLVYADFCEENGRDQRAALIRAQRALDPLIEPSVEQADGYLPPDPRILEPRQLRPSLRLDILAPFRGFAETVGNPLYFNDLLAGAAWFGVRRGFVERLRLLSLDDLINWLRHAAECLSLVPITELTSVEGPDSAYYSYPQGMIPPSVLQELLTVDGIGRIRKLDLSLWDFDGAGARTLVAHSGALRLDSLVLSIGGMTDQSVADINSRFGTVVRWRPEGDAIPF